jgi:5'-nucleotidase
MDSAKKQILLTNDDGIESPGLWAAAEALSALGFVTVAAPRQQFSGAGRSHPIHSDGIITPRQLKWPPIWTAYAVNGRRPNRWCMPCSVAPQDHLIVSINYGENVGPLHHSSHCRSWKGRNGIHPWRSPADH